MKIVVFAIGKPKSEAVCSLVNEYSKRMRRFAPFEVVCFRDEEKVLSNIDRQDFLVALDEHGRNIDSRELSKFISGHQMNGTKRIVFFIGGENGVGDVIRKRSNLILSLSKMTFPHELVQVIISEQIYRAYTILSGGPYHRGLDKSRDRL
mgnify:CR=1 FL=1